MTATPDLTVENANLRAQLEALEQVCLELIEERDRAIGELELVSQLSLLEEMRA